MTKHCLPDPTHGDDKENSDQPIEASSVWSSVLLSSDATLNIQRLAIVLQCMCAILQSMLVIRDCLDEANKNDENVKNDTNNGRKNLNTANSHTTNSHPFIIISDVWETVSSLLKKIQPKHDRLISSPELLVHWKDVKIYIVKFLCLFYAMPANERRLEDGGESRDNQSMPNQSMPNQSMVNHPKTRRSKSKTSRNRSKKAQTNNLSPFKYFFHLLRHTDPCILNSVSQFFFGELLVNASFFPQTRLRALLSHLNDDVYHSNGGLRCVLHQIEASLNRQLCWMARSVKTHVRSGGSAFGGSGSAFGGSASRSLSGALRASRSSSSASSAISGHSQQPHHHPSSSHHPRTSYNRTTRSHAKKRLPVQQNSRQQKRYPTTSPVEKMGEKYSLLRLKSLIHSLGSFARAAMRCQWQLEVGNMNRTVNSSADNAVNSSVNSADNSYSSVNNGADNSYSSVNSTDNSFLRQQNEELISIVHAAMTQLVRVWCVAWRTICDNDCPEKSAVHTNDAFQLQLFVKIELARLSSMFKRNIEEVQGSDREVQGSDTQCGDIHGGKINIHGGSSSMNTTTVGKGEPTTTAGKSEPTSDTTLSTTLSRATTTTTLSLPLRTLPFSILEMSTTQCAKLLAAILTPGQIKTWEFFESTSTAENTRKRIQLFLRECVHDGFLLKLFLKTCNPENDNADVLRMKNGNQNGLGIKNGGNPNVLGISPGMCTGTRLSPTTWLRSFLSVALPALVITGDQRDIQLLEHALKVANGSPMSQTVTISNDNNANDNSALNNQHNGLDTYESLFLPSVVESKIGDVLLLVLLTNQEDMNKPLEYVSLLLGGQRSMTKLFDEEFMRLLSPLLWELASPLQSRADRGKNALASLATILLAMKSKRLENAATVPVKLREGESQRSRMAREGLRRLLSQYFLFSLNVLGMRLAKEHERVRAMKGIVQLLRLVQQSSEDTPDGFRIISPFIPNVLTTLRRYVI